MPALRLDTLDADLAASLAALADDLARPDGRVAQSRALVEAALADGRAHYGLNTGFGALKSERIGPDDVAQLQVNLLRSHACGVGDPTPPALTRRMLALKAHALGRGFSGVSPAVVTGLLALLDADLVPVVPQQGSLGASGDLAPLAHLTLPLIGEGSVWDDGRPAPAADALRQAGLEPVALGAKDGLALINGTQFMLAYAVEVAQRARRLATTADVVAAMTLEARLGSARPFDARVAALRPHPGHAQSAEAVRRLLDGSEIGPSHAACGRVQDPYSVRCVPQVHGASRDALAFAAGVVERELNSVTDNPLVFAAQSPAEVASQSPSEVAAPPPAEGGAGGAADVVSAGNFHGQPLAIALDTAAIAVAEWASISERRTYLLVDGGDGLPPFLVERSGLQSGFMIPQYAAAALVSENKTLCHPASVDSIPSSRGQEDHVSMGAWGARKALRVVENAERVLAVEALCAAQALAFRRPLRAGRGVEAAHAVLRERVAQRTDDVAFEADFEAATDLVRSGALVAAAETQTGPLP
ncbi:MULTISPECIES: histidine ammonia-lyase [Rubrivirga]|uniref:Histidine ammonia-lyase n=1 Tax=Rubrivirga litoralis TaxID=3075598 RepID=A0ABU3BN23_9BACT|nr:MULTISPECIES: histidine ammonia-lyase [unclassified Rubrivirga]MDT0630704.1 histidine ammonia-lyase [Rubrivirga sp. F394]